MKLKGKIIMIGGAENRGEENDNMVDFSHDGILMRIVDESAHGKNSRIEILPTASTMPEEIGDEYIKAFRKLKATNTGVLNISNREEAESKNNIKRLKEADVLFVTGGDQIRLTSILGGTLFFEILVDRLQNDAKFMYAGTSAGAAAASESMICNGESADAINKGEVKTATGFGLVENIMFDTHFISRGRIGRLFQIVVTNPKTLGVGMEENSGLLIHNNKMEAIGPGMTLIIDGRTIRATNLLEIKLGVPISIDNLTLHVMSKTDVFDLEERTLKIVTPEECRV
jgi:cyanophycinase